MRTRNSSISVNFNKKDRSDSQTSKAMAKWKSIDWKTEDGIIDLSDVLEDSPLFRMKLKFAENVSWGVFRGYF